MSGPRISLLTREFPPEVYGGAGVHVAELARALDALVDVEVHCFGAPRDTARAYGSWELLEGTAPYHPALQTLATDLLMADGVAGTDLVHSHTWYANFAGHLAKLLHGVPHVVTTHSLEPLRPWKREQLAGGYGISSFAERTALEGADAVIAVSAGMRGDVLTNYPAVDPDRVRVIHNGVDPHAWRPVTATGAVTDHGIDLRRPSVVFVGRITRQKGVVHLLDAAAHLGDVQLVLCAGAPDTPEIAAEFRTRVAQLQAEGREVIWIERMLPREELVQILSHARAFVCPSVYEPFGIVNLEAMACGLPVVASRVGGIPEIVLPGETGELVPLEPSGDALGTPADPAGFARDLAAAITGLVEDPERAERMGSAGRRRVVEHFSWATIAARTAALYEELLS